MLYFALKYVHIIGASVLLGTGVGIAFFMLLAHRTNDPAIVAGVARMVVIADYLFTATAVTLQPITGVALAWYLGYSLWEHWLMLSILLYIVTGVFWLPVVWIQREMRREAETAVQAGVELSPRYHTLYRTWFAFGFPAFAAVLAIFWLMIHRAPEIW